MGIDIIQKDIKANAINRVKTGYDIQSTIINVAEKESDQSQMVSVHQFEIHGVESPAERMEAINHCIQGVEWEVGKDGLRSICSVFVESHRRADDRILYIQTKTETEEISEIHLFENPTMQISASGELVTEYEETVYRCNLKEN